MIVGTAGHIDHGKTTLVRALTGVDTDRLKEEKARGISIELGYAYVPSPDGEVLGYIDVPGHERLVHTMLAGACGIDYALIVVAADDGVMPQTREHVAILDLLGVADGVVALTKVDRVESRQIAAVTADVERLLAPTGLRAAPVFAVNATDPRDPGVASLAAHLTGARHALPRRPASGLFRLAIDRVFTRVGYGTVITGTAFAGRIAVGDSATLLPTGIGVRVRGIRAQNRPAEAGEAGQRLALNLAGAEPAQISRGDWLADPRGLAPTTRIDARLTLLAGEGPVLRSWAPVHVHFGATHRTAHLVPLDGAALGPGETGRVQLVFDDPVCGPPGERFVLRNAQATHTLGGGRLLDPRAPARRRRSPARQQYLEALERTLAAGDAATLIGQAPWGFSVSDLMLATAAPVDVEARPPGTRLVAAGRGPEEQFLVREADWRAGRDRVLAALAEFHAAAPDEPGPDAARLRRIAAPAAAPRLWRALLDELVAEELVLRSGAWLRLPGHAATLSAREREAAGRLEPLLAAGGFDPPWVRDLAVRTGEPEARVRQLLVALGREGRAYQVVHDLFYARAALASLATVIAGLAREHGRIEAAGFRDAIGIGRKRAIQILEFFDRVGYTRRMPDGRVLRDSSGWAVDP
ncbi:MAG TPA: selenocysteine-specific translation elongation factor [Steroidobacteraceae bacterium]|nr:selenocysteine-specific translation elongation factor [Steroidobacteraceae bacterium]